MNQPETIDVAGGGAGIEVESHSIDYIPQTEWHARLGSQGPFWFLGNFHFFTISIGFVGPGMGLSAGWTTLAGAWMIGLGAWQMRGIAAYVVGFVAMIPFFYVYDAEAQKEVFVGYVARLLGGVDIAWLVGLIVAGGSTSSTRRPQAHISHLGRIAYIALLRASPPSASRVCNTSSINPYDFAVAADMKLSRSVSLMISSMLRPVCSAMIAFRRSR